MTEPYPAPAPTYALPLERINEMVEEIEKRRPTVVFNPADKGLMDLLVKKGNWTPHNLPFKLRKSQFCPRGKILWINPPPEFQPTVVRAIPQWVPPKPPRYAR